MAVSVLVHAAVIAWTWHAAPPRKPMKEAARLSVRLVARAPQAVVAAPKPAVAVPQVAARRSTTQPPTQVTKTARPAAAVVKARPVKTAAAPVKPAVTEAAATPPETIDGSVFALPQIAIGGSAAPRWMKAHASASMPPPSAMPPPAMHAHAAREAGRMQIVLALQRQVSAWQAPDDAGDGTCSLRAQVDAPLDCDSAALQEVVGAQASSLSGLLAAYRSIDPGAGGLSIAYQQGRYRVALASAAAQPQ